MSRRDGAAPSVSEVNVFEKVAEVEEREIEKERFAVRGADVVQTLFELLPLRIEVFLEFGFCPFDFAAVRLLGVADHGGADCVAAQNLMHFVEKKEWILQNAQVVHRRLDGGRGDSG